MPAPTFADVLAARLRREPGQPLVTYYDDATGERVELSVATYANWVAKTASLLVDELDAERGETVRVDLPTHWLGPVVLGAAWTAGLVATYGDAPNVVVTGPDGLERWAGHPRAVACALLPLGRAFPEPPAGYVDLGREVWGQPDAFVPFDPPTATDLAVDGLSHAALFGSGTPRRLLTASNPATRHGLATFVEPLVGGGSTVWVRHPAGDQTHRAAAEQAEIVG